MSYYDQINLHTEDQKNNASTFNEPLEKIINNIEEVKNLTEINEAGIVSTLDLLLNDYTTTEQLNEILNNGIKGDKGETGVGLNFDWNGTSLGVKREDETNFIYSDLKGEKGDSGLEKDEVRSMINEELQKSITNIEEAPYCLDKTQDIKAMGGLIPYIKTLKIGRNYCFQFTSISDAPNDKQWFYCEVFTHCFSIDYFYIKLYPLNDTSLSSFEGMLANNWFSGWRQTGATIKSIGLYNGWKYVQGNSYIIISGGIATINIELSNDAPVANTDILLFEGFRARLYSQIMNFRVLYQDSNWADKYCDLVLSPYGISLYSNIPGVERMSINLTLPVILDDVVLGN